LKISPMHSLWDFQSGWNIALNLARVCDVSTNAVYSNTLLFNQCCLKYWHVGLITL